MSEEKKESAKIKFCPFSKAPCGKDICALWSWTEGDGFTCAFISIAESLRKIEEGGIDVQNNY